MPAIFDSLKQKILHYNIHMWVI